MNSMMQKASENKARAMSMQKTAQNLGDLIAGDAPPVQVVHTVEMPTSSKNDDTSDDERQMPTQTRRCRRLALATLLHARHGL